MTSTGGRTTVLWAILIGLIAIALVAASLLVWVVTSGRFQPPFAGPDDTSKPALPVMKGKDGIGDPYFPDYGATGYNATKYDIDVTFDPTAETINGTTTMSAVADPDAQWSTVSLDLLLPVGSVEVNGEAAEFTQQRGSRNVDITPVTPVTGEFTVTVSYAGRPADYLDERVQGWLVKGEEWVLAGEPESAPLWFASNDHPRDPATYDISLRVPAGMQALSAGRLLSTDAGSEDDWDTWHYEQAQPVPTYSVFVAFGSFSIERGEADGLEYVYAVSNQLGKRQRAAIMDVLDDSGRIVRALEEFLGPYPLDSVGGVVPVVSFWFGALETAGRPVYHVNAAVENVVVHELAHMWVGNTVTLYDWNDIYINEAMASYAEWVYAERHGGRTAQQAMDAMLGRFSQWSVIPSDPGADKVFTVAYTRGPMSLQALRNVYDDDAGFFAMWKQWAQTTGPRSLEDFRAFAQEHTSHDLTDFFTAWLDSPQRPEQTAGNGFR